LAGHDQESEMGPTISVYRKGDEVYLTLAGDFDKTSSQHILHTLRRLVVTSLKCAAPDFPVAFTFKTHSKVNIKNLKVNRGAMTVSSDDPQG
jgi:hypothetical protein